MNFAKFLRRPFSQNTSGQLLLIFFKDLTKVVSYATDLYNFKKSEHSFQGTSLNGCFCLYYTRKNAEYFQMSDLRNRAT